jgi:hypothetical protein
MAQITVKQIIDEFPFLDDRTAQEPFIYEVLREIRLYQKEGYQKGSGGFASREVIASSRNIHIPITPTREKNIEYILELLSTRFKDWIHLFVTFEFAFDETTKKLAIREKEEYSININSIEEIDRLQKERDDVSLENFLEFISKFRLFNLDKMIKRVRNRDALNNVFQKGLGTSFFTYNHYTIERGKAEAVEEYCFHANNYESVKKSLNLAVFRTLVTAYGDFVKTRLRKYGIMNGEFGDYRDNKIDYILSILLDDIQSPLIEKDRIEIKNFKMLRQCVLQVDKVLDPVKTLNADITSYIKKNGCVAATELTANILNITADILSQWETDERLLKENIVREKDRSGALYYIDALSLPNLFTVTIETEKKAGESQTDAFYQNRGMLFHSAAKQILLSASARDILGGSEAELSRLVRLVEEYEALQKRKTIQIETVRQAPSRPMKKRPLIVRLLSFITSMFSAFPADPADDDSGESGAGMSEAHHERREPRKETKEIYEKAKQKRGPVVPLSDLIELKPDNEPMVQRIISELRDNNMRIVVPIYNARTSLYPKRSGKLLMSDVEYLLVPPQVIKSIDTISEYINSLVGIKLKDEPIPNRGLVALEKYLRVLHRQRRASQMRKKDQREKAMRP